MILRRLADAFRRQDWATVLIEFLIVVAGIFVGLQVNNWNQLRQERGEVEAALEQIATEAELLIARYEENLEWLELQSERNVLILGILDGAPVTPENQATFDAGLREVIRFPPFTLDIQSLEELIGAGHLSLIGDEKISTAIIDYISQRHTQNLVQTRVMALLDSATPIIQQHIGYDFEKSNAPQRGPYILKVHYDLDDLRSDPDIRNAISNVALVHYAALTGAPRGLYVLENLVEAIRGKEKSEDVVETPL